MSFLTSYTLCRFAAFAPVGSVSRDFRVAAALLQITFACHLKGKREFIIDFLLIARPEWSWAIALRNTEYAARNFMNHIRPFQGLGLSLKGRYHPSPNGDTFFQRKKALALRHAALVTPGVFP